MRTFSPKTKFTDHLKIFWARDLILMIGIILMIFLIGGAISFFYYYTHGVGSPKHTRQSIPSEFSKNHTKSLKGDHS